MVAWLTSSLHAQLVWHAVMVPSMLECMSWVNLACVE
jgi:hypothetical protein